MGKENVKRVGTFEAEFDRVTHRTSYNSEFKEHYMRNLGIISGFLGMLYQLVETDSFKDVSSTGLSFIVLEMQDKVSDLLADL
jgi:hypothetical protein